MRKANRHNTPHRTRPAGIQLNGKTSICNALDSIPSTEMPQLLHSFCVNSQPSVSTVRLLISKKPLGQ